MRTPGASTITLKRPQVIADRGANIPDWTAAPTATTVTGCDLQPGASAEDSANRGGQRAAWTILAPITDDTRTLTGDARVTFNGRDWPLIGDPEVWEHPRLGHVKILVASWRELP